MNWKMFKFKKPIMIKVEHYTVFFKTIDNKNHSFHRYRFANPNVINCSIPEYIMIEVKHNGYLIDDNNVMYPLQNIISITWEKDNEKEVEKIDDWEVFY